MANWRLWTDDDTTQLRRLAVAGWNDTRIGETMGWDRTFIVHKRAEHKIHRGQSAGLTSAMARINLRRLTARAQ